MYEIVLIQRTGIRKLLNDSVSANELIADASWNDDDSQRKIRSSLLIHRRFLLARLSRLVLVWAVLETLVPPLQVDLVVLKCRLRRRSCVAWLQPLLHQIQAQYRIYLHRGKQQYRRGVWKVLREMS